MHLSVNMIRGVHVSLPRSLPRARLSSAYSASKAQTYYTRSVAARMNGLAHSAGIHTSSPLQAIVPYKLADIGEGITECEIIQWYVKSGDKVSQFDKICEVQSDKATAEITSRYDGVINKLHYEPGDMAIVGKPLVDIETPDSDQGPESSDKPIGMATAPPISAEAEKERQPSDDAQAQVQEIKSSGGSVVYATPAVRRVARESDVDLAQVKGSGKRGRILKEDVLNHVKGQTIAENDVTPQPTVAPSAQEQTNEVVSLTPLQKVMFKNMTESLKIPHFSFKEEVEIDETTKARAEINKQLASPTNLDTIKKVSYMPFLIKAASKALEQHPVLNARLVVPSEASAQPHLEYRASHNISIAMDTPKGLMTPNIKNVESKSIMEIARELSRLQQAGKTGKITQADMNGGTFSLSNIGNIGGTYLFPMLVPSQLCIGAIGRIQRLPRYESSHNPATGAAQETLVPKSIMAVSWCADHRVIDGATLARFASLFKKYLESPITMLANLK